MTTLNDKAININLDDGNGGTMLLAIKHSDLLMSGVNVGDTDNTCYFGVFRSHINFPTYWTVGNILLRNYYMILDMTPFDERSE